MLIPLALTIVFASQLTVGPIPKLAGLNQDGATKRGAELDRKLVVERFQSPGPLLDVKPDKEDFAKVLAGGRYFAHADGRPLIVIGYNHNPDWTELERANPLSPRHDLSRVDRWFKKLTDHGVNVIRMMAETPPSGNLEEKPGTFRPEHVQWLDAVVTSARKHGVKLWITPYDTFWMNRRADKSPYWRANGGPIGAPIDFLTKPEIIELQKNRMKYLIDRYGNLGTVLAWELMNEIDIWWGASPEQIKSWTDKLATFTRSYQRKRWGRNHMISISMAQPMPKGLNGETAFRRKDLDFATAHLYIGKSKGPAPGDEIEAGEEVGRGVRYALSMIKDNRPFTDGESGPIDKWIPEASRDSEVFHQMTWAHLISGGAGSGMRWPYRHPHHLTDGMLQTLQGMRRFADAVSWKLLNADRAKLEVTVPEGWATQSLGTSKAALVWVQGDVGTTQRVDITWSCATGTIQVRAFDPRKGAWVANAVPKKGPAISLEVPQGELVWLLTR